MKLKLINPKDAVKSDKQTIEKENINSLQKGIKTLLEKLDKDTTAKEEHSERVGIMSFLKTADYDDADFAFEEGKIDLAIKANNKFGVLFETKSSLETKDMISHDNLNVKPMQQVIYYYLQQRTSGNNEIKHIIVTNGYDWYIFDALDFDRLFYRDNKLLKDFKEHQSGAKAGKLTENFYNEIAKTFIENSDAELKAVYFNLKEYTNGKQTELKALYKLLSGKNLLKKKKQIDSNKLNTKFFKELLYIMGLEEQKEGSKKLIRAKTKPDEGSLLENLKVKIEAHRVLNDFKNIEKYGNTYKEQLFGISLELVLTWINRLLFLKLLEGQLADYHKDNSDKYKFLNYKKVNEFDILDTLFFEVLNVPVEDRKDKIKERYPNIPYLNSSLFEPLALEKKVAFISAMKDNLFLPLYSQTVLTNETVKELPTLDYLLKFFEAYNFASHAEDDIYTEKGELINASVLGLVFEKINGYKEGSFYTPGFITEYMARETIRKAVIQKFNDTYKLNIADFDELRNYTIGNAYKKDKIIEFNKLINSLKIVDPAVGSGHFLVSSLNEILSIKSELGILADEEGNRLACKIEIENDTAVINDTQNKLFRYSLDEENKIIEDKNKIQSGIFHEKKTIIENCLFGVDINPNSVKICRLRLWIELLKNSYYNSESLQLETLPNIDINIKEGNSLISRFPLDADLSKALKGSKWNLFSYQNAVQTYKNTKDRNVKQELVKLIDEIKSNFTAELRSQNPKLVKLNKLKNKFYDLFSGNMLFEPSEEYGGKNINKETEKKREVQKRKMESEINKLSEEINEIKISKIYRNALEWRFEFPEVLDDKGNFVGFDVVIGNPPYVRIRDIDNSQKDIYMNYHVAENQLDLFHLFIERSFQIQKANGLNSLIVPNTFLANENNKKLRLFILQKFNVLNIIDIKSKVFDDANVDVLMYLFQKTKDIGESNYFEISDNQICFKHKFDISNFWDNLNYNFSVTLDNASIKILKKIIDKSKTVDNFFDVTTGVKEYQVGKGKPRQTKEHRERNIFHADYKKDDTFLPEIRGRNLSRYSVTWNNEYISYGEWLAEPRQKHFFEGDKLLIRQIPEKNNLVLSLEESYYIVDQTVYIAKLKSDVTDISEKAILALLNSKLVFWYFSNINNEFDLLFPKIKVKEFKALPVFNFSRQEQQPFISKVDKILKLKKENPQADTIALEAEIDKMVYELYELTEEEIGIVENS